jgi:hypothetical protein
VKPKSKNDPRETDATETVLRRLIRAPETAHQIYELADGGGGQNRRAGISVARVNSRR